MFDWIAFSDALDRVKGQRNVTWNHIAGETGVSVLALLRIPDGHRMSLDDMVKVCKWAQLRLDDFIK